MSEAEPLTSASSVAKLVLTVAKNGVDAAIAALDVVEEYQSLLSPEVQTILTDALAGCKMVQAALDVA
jgi:hypothetical protein